METYLTPALFALITGFAALVHGAAGIGFPLVATPLMAMITDVRSAILILVLPTILLNIANMLHGGRWGKSIARYWPLALYGMGGSYLGTQLLIVVPAEVFRPVLAAAMILYLNAERIGVGFSWVRSHPRIAAAVFGTLAGLLGGTVNVMLPALVIFALEIRMDKTAMIQVFNFCFLFGKLTQGAVFVSAGLLTAEILKSAVPLAALSLPLMLAAMKIRNRLPEETYRRWLRILLYIMAGVLLAQTVAG
ncbi:MAG TPA: hypothetical protein DHV36_14070 [Desulfobacteraceae bacterium]|nr:hypothetical protein [Desulfobacteraceae bacterium]